MTASLGERRLIRSAGRGSAHIDADFSDFTRDLGSGGLEYASYDGAVLVNRRTYNNMAWFHSLGDCTFTDVASASRAVQIATSSTSHSFSYSQLGWFSQVASPPTTTLLDANNLEAVTLTVGLALICAFAASGTEAAVDFRPHCQSGDETSTLSRFQQELERWNGRLITGTWEGLLRQLSYLLEDEEDLADGAAPDAKSFEALSGYLAARPWVKAPSLTLTRSGIFVGNWRPNSGAKARLFVDFIDEKRVRWSAADAREGKPPASTGGICCSLGMDEHLENIKAGCRPLKVSPSLTRIMSFDTAAEGPSKGTLRGRQLA